MAKKTTSTAAKKKEQERLNQGGQNIANIAQNIVARRQEQAVNKTGQQYGIRRTAGDMMATRALGAIQDREMLSYRKRLEEEERRRREAEEARRQNVAGNLRSAAMRVNTGGMAGNPTQEKLRKSSLETILDGLNAKIGNEQKIINEQGRAEDDPARIRAEKELKDLAKRQKDTQEKIASIPQVAGSEVITGISGYTPEEEAYIQRLQKKLERGQSRKQTIPAVWNQDLKAIQHMRNAPEKAEGDEYIKWLEEGGQIGLTDKQTTNALIAQAGKNDDPLAQYMALDDSQKSGWLRNAGKNVQQLLTMGAAKRYNQQHPYATDRDELLAQQEYFTGLRDEAQSALDRMNGNIRIMYRPDDGDEYEIRGRSNPYYQQNPEAINEQFYDALVGPGEYQKRKAEFTDDPEGWEKADQLELQLTEAWDAYEQGRWNDAYRILTGKNNYAEMESQLGYANVKLDTIQGQLNLYDQYDAFMSGYTGAQRASYDAEKDRGFDSLVDYGTRNNPNHRPAYRDPNTKDVHRVYSFINQGKEYKAYIDNATGGDENAAKIDAVYGKSALMLPEEIEIFNGYYNAGKYQEASAFFNGLSMALNDRYAKYEEIENREQARKYPVLSSFETLLAEQMSGALAIPRTFAGFAGEKSVYDPNSAWYASSRYTEQTQDEIANMIGGEGGKFYLQGMNTLRNLTNAAMVALAGVPASGQAAAGLAMFATQIYQDQTYKYLKETNDYGKATGMATLDAVLETMEEMLPYEVMLKGGGNILLDILKNSTSEALEELTGATVGEAIKGLITGRQDWEKRRDQIYNEGGYTDDSGNWIELDRGDSNKALAEAQTQAWKEKGHEIIENTVAGFVGGSMGASYGQVRNYLNTRSTGAQVNSKEGGFNTLLTAARGMNEDSATRKLAEQLYAKQQKGKNISNYQTGQLAQTMYQESGQEIRDVIEGAMTRKVEGELVQEGASDEYAAQAAPIIAQAVTTGKTMKKADVKIIAKENAGLQLMESYLTGEKDAKEAIKKAGGEAAMNANQAVRDVLGEKQAPVNMKKPKEELLKYAPIAKQKDLDEAEGARHDNGLDAVVNKQVVQVIGRKGDQYIILDENNNERTVNKNDVRAAGENLGLLMEYADRNRNIIDDKSFREMAVGLKDNRGIGIDEYLEQSARAVINYRTGGEVTNSKLAKSTLSAYKATAQMLNDEWDQERTKKAKNQRKATPGKGIVTYKGIKAGTEEWENTAKKAGPLLGNQLRIIGEIGVRLGNEIEIVEREDLPDAFGWQDPETGKIYVNLAAENVKGIKNNRHVLTVTAHELTHWLEQNSPEEYKTLRNFVFNSLRNSGMDIASRVIERIDNFRGVMGKEMTVNEALAEIVADACDQVLTNEQVAKQLEAESPNLYQKIKTFVKNFIETVRKYAGTIDTSKESRKMMQAGQETLDEMARIWLGARSEALGRQTGNHAEAKEGNGQAVFSTRERTDGIDITDAINNKEKYKKYFTYDNLIKKAPVKIVDIGAENNNKTRADAVANAINNVKKYGVTKNGEAFVHIDDTNSDVIVNKNSVRHSLDRRTSQTLMEHIGDLLKNSFVVNISDGREQGQTAAYHLVSVARNERGLVYVCFNVNRYTHSLDSVDVLYSTRQKKEAAGRGPSGLANKGVTLTASTISISDVFEAVKTGFANVLPLDVMNKLKEPRRITKDTQYLRYSTREAENQGIKDLEYALAHPHVKFSMREPIEATKDGLVAVHNLRENEFYLSIQEGGLTAPSVAIVHARTGHNKYGDVSVVFSKDAIDPEKMLANRVYGADAWTPTRGNAKIYTKLDYDEMYKIRKRLEEILSGKDVVRWRSEATNWINQWLSDDSTSDTLDDMIDRAYNNLGMIAAYNTAMGNEIEPFYDEVAVRDNVNKDREGVYKDILSALEENGMLNQFMADMESLSLNEIMDKYAPILKGAESEIVQKTANAYIEDTEGRMWRRVLSTWIKGANEYEQDGREIKTQQVFNQYKTGYALKEKTDETGFRKWVKELLGKVRGKRGVYNGKDIYTRSGDRRSFEYLHDEPTAENIVRAMYANHERKGGEAGGATGLMAKASKEYRSIAEVREDAENRLKVMDEGEYKQLVKDLDERIDQFLEEAVNNAGWDYGTIRKSLIEAGGEYARAGEDAVRRYFKRENIKLTEKQINEALELMKTAQEIPAGYFEAKPERVVGLDEIKRVILPESASQELFNAMNERGIPYDTYDGTDEDRLAKLNSVENVQFSTREAEDQEYMDAVNSGDMEKAQRMVDQAAEAAGYTIRGDHGTVSKYFTIFDRQYGNAEGDWGKGFYFTNNQDDVETNYASEEGADLTAKIELLAEQMEWMDEYADMDEDERMEAARQQLAGGEPRVIHAALKMDNPVYIGGPEETFFDYTEEYDEENDEYGEPEGSLIDFIEALNDVLSEYEYANVDTSSLYTEGMDYGGLRASDLEKMAKELVQYVEDDEGKLAGHEIVREAFERAGFDGIVDNTVAQKFGSRSGRRNAMVGVDTGTTHYIAFQPEQIKQTDPVTYDDAGNVIPLSKRFNPEQRDIRYSTREPDMEVNHWMMGLTDSSLRTVQERMLWKQYKGVRLSWELAKHAIHEQNEQLRKLEAKNNKTAMDTFEIEKIKKQIEKWEEKKNEYEEQLLKVTTDKGYAAIMYRERNKMENLLNGRTEDEVRKTIDAIQEELDTVEKEMAERNAKLKELAERENVKIIRNQLNSAGLRRIAAKLKENLGSELQNKEIENRLALLALKMKQGKVDSTEIMELADMLVGSMKPAYDDYVLSELRGMTIGLNSSEQETLKNRGMNIRDLQRELTGTGIRVVAGGPNTIDKNWEELTGALPNLDPAANPGDMLWGPDTDHKGLMDLVEDAIRQQKAMGPDSDQVAAMVLEAASDLVPEVLTDAKSMKLIRESMEFIAEINQGTEALDNIENLFNRLRKKNATAKATLGTLENKIVDAIEYNNELAKQHDVTAWRQERRAIIEQLKDKHTKEMLELQEKYRQKIAKDKKARDLMADNNALRREIHMDIAKYRRLIVNETDRENVPEAYKPLAREMLMKIIRNDLAEDRKVTAIDKEKLADAFHFLSGMNARDGRFSLADLQMLPEDVQDEVADALSNIDAGLMQYNDDTKGKDIIENLTKFRDGLEQIAEAVNLITNVINKARSISYMDRERKLDDEAARVIRDLRRIKKEPAGKGSKSINAIRRSVFYGNMTPVYFFKNLKNAGIFTQWEEFEAAENRNGLELTKAKAFFDKVAEDCHYKSWDLDKKFTVSFNNYPMQVTTEQIMALYATWQREKMIGPEESHHLETGGVILDDGSLENGKLRMEKKQQKARKVKDGDMAAMLQLLTTEQKQYVHKIVSYLSKEMSDLGNEASMRMYGIKKYNEKWYFPFKVWNGVLSARSDKGITGTDENRAAHKGWSKRRKNNAGNALVIGNFTDTAVKHVVEMINYNTFAPAIENLNKILNYQTVEVDQNQEEERRNIRVMFQEAYGKEALRYLEDWMKDLQGGVTQDQRKTLRDRLISMFKKNAVAGSLSVTLQQPLSYIRAAMLINPKYLAGALSPQYWKGSYQEMLDHSGVAVIKQMGKFDMNFGRSAQDWIKPQSKMNAYEKISDVLTAAPQAADTMTWTRMWSAVKMEQHAQHPDMDIKSEDFLNLVGKRFNEVMRRTQVYDSTLTKSSNMRSQALSMKLITSFMAEPTLSLNVLADAVMNAKQKGGKATLAKAAATYLLSAVLQAAVKGFMGAGRSPDEKKTAAENVLNKILYNMLSEANPFSLIPGYSDLVEVLKNGELKDDALGVLGKLKSVYTTAQNITNPDKSKGPWRDVEDTAGQILQLITNIPLKNLMRDARAMYNWATGAKFADRDTSGAVLKYQGRELLMNGDNLLGVINSWLGDAGYKTSNKAYYTRMYNAMAGGNQDEAEGIREYLELAKGQDSKKVQAGLRTAAREDDSKTPAETSQWMIDNDLLDGTSSITTQYKKGEITREEAEGLYKAASPKMTDNDIFWKLDQMDYEKETGETETGYYYRLRDAITKNKADEIQAAVKALLAHGITKEKIKDKLSDWKAEYTAGDSAKKIQIRDAITKAYKAAGYTADDANKTIERWNKEAKKAEPEKKDANDTTGRWGRGNIDLNNRKVVENNDGTISTERSFSVNIDGKEVLLPTVIDGKIVSEEEAIRHYEQTGQYLGKFNSVKEAEEYAEKLHKRQEWYYNQ